VTKEYFDIIIFTPLETESEAVFETFPHVDRRTSDNVLKYTLDLKPSGLTALLAQPPEWGNREALKTAQHLFEKYDAGLIICLGIAGALSKDLKLGDVCYSGTIFDVNERMKVKETKGKRSKGVVLEHNPKPLNTPRSVTVALNQLRADPHLKATLYAPWQVERRAYLQGLVDKGELSQEQKATMPDAPKAKDGALICGPVVASTTYSEILQGLDRKVLAVETESGGVFEAADDAGVAALTIRGISDNADAKKNLLEQETNDGVRLVASRNAVTFLKAQLSNPFLVQFLKDKRDQRTGTQLPGIAEALPQLGSVPQTIEELGEQIGSKLKELCPEFPLTKKGYRLPSPRIKSIRLEDDPRATQNGKYTDLLEAVSTSQVIFVDIPRNYPDLALPWIWAGLLSDSTINDNQIVPVVINADNLAPPATLESIIPKNVAEATKLEGVEVVFVIAGVNAGSRSRTNHLAAEVKKYPGARFVLITKGEGTLLLQRELLRKISGRAYSLGEVSFLAISEFLQAAFEVSATEAEVIALKLRETFSKFKLSAHPTFFAGIPQPMLSSLLQANRRAELIQLAVDGYLTLIATQDEEKTHLNRSTRARFLGRLTVEMDVEKKVLSQAELIAFTKAFATEYDFDDLDPLPFINSFIDKGILQFEEGNLGFTLPFVRSYLLATALRDDPALAKRYFDFSADDFDYETFDLYSELGPSADIVADVEQRLEKDLETLQATDDNTEFLLSDKLRPSLLEKGDRLGEIRANIQRTIQTLQDRSDDGRGKQKLLDIADNTNAQVEQKVENVSTGDASQLKPGQKIDTAELDRLLRNWRTANVLLGAAAQRLQGPTKQRLALLLVKGGAAIADRLTRLYAKVDFHEIKVKALNSVEVGDFLSKYSSGMDKAQLAQMVGYLIDFVELYILALPFRAIITDLCDQSGDKVLAGSVDRTEPPQGVASLLHASWLADLDSKRAMTKLRKELKEMPLAPFLRVILAQHFLNRVYWRHWEDIDRSRLLEAAAEVVKAFGSLSAKGELERLIGQPTAKVPDKGRRKS
jgi:nucleoside phosphorylase